MTDKERRIRHIVEILENQVDTDLYRVHNEFCSKMKYEETIYDMCELDDILMGKAPSEVLCMGHGSDFSPYDDYFYFHNYLLESFDDFEGSPVSIRDIADYIWRNEETFGIDDIEDYFNEIKEENNNED